MTIRQHTRNSFAALLFVAALAAPAGAADDARAIVARCAERQTTTERAAELTKPGAVTNLHVELDVTAINVGKHSGVGRLFRWYLRGVGPKKDQELVRTSWRGSHKRTDTGRALNARGGVLGWVRSGTRTDWLTDDVKHAEDLEQIQRDIDEMRDILDFFLLRKLLGPEAKFTSLGVEKGAGRTAHKIRRTAPNSRPLILWIDTKTHVLHGVQIDATREGETQLNYCFDGQKTFEGVRVPFKVEVYERPFAQPKSEGKLLFRAFIDAVKFNDPKLTTKTFEPEKG